MGCLGLRRGLGLSVLLLRGGDKLVGSVDFSDYPAAAKKLPRVGSYARVDVEAIVALKPDLVLAWDSGNPPASIAQLRKLGL